MNKVKFGLKNAHYAVITDTAGVITYATPVALPLATSLTLNAEGELIEFYADDELQFSDNVNNGYAGDLEFSNLPDSFRTDVLKERVGASGALFENAKLRPVPFALLCEFDGDVEKTRHVFYNVLASRPKVASTTKTKSLDPQMDSLSVKASPASDTGDVKAKFKPVDTGYDEFFETVQVYAAPA